MGAVNVLATNETTRLHNRRGELLVYYYMTTFNSSEGPSPLALIEGTTHLLVRLSTQYSLEIEF